ncbi:copper resistance CopC/CopD family protein [Paenibacillus hexagrammi]|uniref:Copper resistance protein CopC/CopD n=1 Tax=Paenibacillus hexagrammi TaxID=2908839 RepID=A0ABY3SK91_9BACL|nr:copper resistance protein CopC [Paenibacillus sp. YPD9-1]UJF34448.1 copper resistance protein CopC/CopD [Paenibacillus sp. YPD9-1]
MPYATITVCTMDLRDESQSRIKGLVMIMNNPITLFRFKRRMAGMVLVLLLLLLGLSSQPGQALAHASLVESTPQADSKFAESPAEVSLTFNERLDDGLFYIKVYNSKGREAVTDKAVMNADHTGMILKLPQLPEGVYLISYHVISADGHPVGGSYPITVGNPPQEEKLQLPTGQVSHQHGLSSGSFSNKVMLQYAFRGLWYFTVLALAGWVIWLRLFRRNRDQKGTLSAWTLNLQRGHLIALLLLIFTHVEDLLGGGGARELWELMSATSVGISWVLLLLLSFIGFAVVGRWALLDIVWGLALLAVKCFSGHAASFSPYAVTVTLDFVHLAAAALWVGGLLMLLVKWLGKTEDRATFIRAFSRMAFLSILVLVVSGFISIWLFLPNWHYLLYSGWGQFMLAKIGAVVLVLVTGIILRILLRKKKDGQVHIWVKIDFSLMAVIILLVGLITYLAPIPANEPLMYHVMGDKIHMTAEITPKVQGTNTFVTKVWLPEKLGEPKHVEMILHYVDDKNISPIQVPVAPYKEEDQLESYGDLASYSYKVSGAYLTLRGNWDLEIRVMDSEDNETVYHKDFILY